MMKDRTVLFVDDEIHIINALKRGLLDETYKKLYALTGEEALGLMENDDVNVIVTDMRMPGMNGLELLKIIGQKYPDTIKIVLSGYTQLPQILATINKTDIFKFITKPWDLEDELIPIVREALDAYNIKIQNKQFKEELNRKNEMFKNILKATDEKWLNVKEDYKNIKKLNLFIFEYLENEITKDEKSIPSVKLLNDFMCIKQFSLNYLETLPTKDTTFSIEKLNEDLLNCVSDHYDAHRIRISFNKVSDFEFCGNYHLLNNLIKDVIDCFLNNGPDHTMGITINTTNHDKISYLHLVMEFYSDSMKMDIDILLLLLKKSCEMIGGEMCVVRNEEQYKAISLRLEFKIER